MKLLKACIALAAFAAFFVAPTIASASPELTSPTGTTAKGNHETTAEGKGDTGLLIEANNVAHSGTVKNTKLVTPIGPIECTTATLTGQLITNTGTNIEGEITTASFTGTPASPESTHCAGPGGFGTATVTPSHSVNPVHGGVGSLPYCVKANTIDDKITIRGGTCTEVARAIHFTIHSSVLGACSYSRASLTATYTTHPADAVATVTSGQTFSRVTGSGFCPASGELLMAFTLKVDGSGTPGTPVYIS